MTTDMINILHRTLTVMVALPFALQLWSFILCTGHKKAAINIHTTSREIFRSIKLRYTNSAKLNIPLADTHSFVSKYFYGKGGPFRFISHLERTSAIMLCISLLGTTAMYIRDFVGIRRMVAVIVASLCYYIFRTAFSTAKQMALTVDFTIDYLENTLKHRVSPEPLRQKRSDTPDIDSVKNIAPINNPINSDKNISKAVNVTNTDEPSDTDEELNRDIADNIIKLSNALQNDNSDIIESVIQEFLA